jgi:hypothetical protein
MARGANTPLLISISTPLPLNFTGRNLPPTNTRRLKYTTPYLERFIGKDESLYPIFYGLLEAKLRIDAQAISREYE